MGGQTGLNIAKTLAESGVLEKYGVELIGAKLPSIDRAEDRDLFKKVRVMFVRVISKLCLSHKLLTPGYMPSHLRCPDSVNQRCLPAACWNIIHILDMTFAEEQPASVQYAE
jgi:hypothetical protein